MATKLLSWFLPLCVFFLACESERGKAPQGRQRILIIVEDRLAPELAGVIDQYRRDLEAEGYHVNATVNVNSTTSPSEIRALLQKNYSTAEGLTGAMLIGRVPAVLCNEKKRQGDPYWHDYLCDLYYMDLDGIWEDSDRNGVYDNPQLLHSPEIWVGRLRTDTLSSLGNEVDLLQQYFTKNHAYRTGRWDLPAPRALIISSTFNILRSDWGARVWLAYPNLVSHQCQDGLATLLLDELQKAPGYQWAVISTPSGPRINHFHSEGYQLGDKLGKTREGRVQLAQYLDEVHAGNDVSSAEIKTVEPRTLFYHLLTSEAGRHDQEDYLAGYYVFGGHGLLAIAGTQHSGAVGTPTDVLYGSIAAGKPIGEAWQEALLWMEQHKDKKYEQFLCDGTTVTWMLAGAPSKAVLIGDGTLKVPTFLSHNERIGEWHNINGELE